MWKDEEELDGEPVDFSDGGDEHDSLFDTDDEAFFGDDDIVEDEIPNIGIKEEEEESEEMAEVL